MNELLKTANLNINSWLISWGLLRGEYQDGEMRTTKFGLINNWFAFWLFLTSTIKWIILMFYSEDSQIAIYFGEWTQWFGPKVFTDSMQAPITLNTFILILLFYFSSKHSLKMLFWLEFMQYDDDNQCFSKLNLDEMNSKKYRKRFALLTMIVKAFNLVFYSTSLITLLISFYLWRNSNHFYYFFSLIIFIFQETYFINHWFGLLIIMCQVRSYLVFIN